MNSLGIYKKQISCLMFNFIIQNILVCLSKFLLRFVGGRHVKIVRLKKWCNEHREI